MLKKQFYKSKLNNSTRDPDEWITELALLRQQLKLHKVIIEDDNFVLEGVGTLDTRIGSEDKKELTYTSNLCTLP